MKKIIILIILAIIGFVCFVQADYDQTIVATTLILEAGGEYDEGSLEAVYEVIYNEPLKRINPFQRYAWLETIFMLERKRYI